MFNWLKRQPAGPKESRKTARNKAPEAQAEGNDQLTPALYFSAERCADMENTLRKISNIRIDHVAVGPTEVKSKTSTLIVDFSRDGKKYQALFAAKRDEDNEDHDNPAYTYSLTSNISAISGKGQRFFTKKRGGLNYLQIEQSMVFVFHEAFVEDEEQREAA